MFKGMVLVHPYFWGSEAMGEEGRDRGWREWMDGLWRAVSGRMKGLDDVWINPTTYWELLRGRLAVKRMGCRRAVVFVAEKDPLRERGRAYWELLRGSEWRGEVEIVESEGEGHVFHLEKMDDDDDKVRELMDELVRFFIKDRLNQDFA